MLKKVLLALDDSEAGNFAQEYAIDLAKEYDATVTGIGVVDVPWITAAQPEPLGGGAFKKHRDDTVIKQSKDHIAFLIDKFKKTCKKRNLECFSVEAEGFPASEIEKVAQEHDMIVIGKTTDFHFELDENTDITVKHIARDNPRPLLIVPEGVKSDGKNVLICLDGDLRSSRALHMFLLLGLGKDKNLSVVSINKEKDAAQRVVDRGIALCASHGIRATGKVVQSSEDAGKSILKLVSDLKTDLIVMGAFSHTMLREALFGSCTKTLMKECEVPLFLYH